MAEPAGKRARIEPASAASVATPPHRSSPLLPVLSLALSYLDTASTLSASLVSRAWRLHSRPAVALVRDKRVARDEVLAQMIDVPQLDAYAYHPACARLHVYRSPGAGLPTAWLLLYELVGWKDEELSATATYLGRRYTIASCSANAQPPSEALEPACGYQLGIREELMQRSDQIGRLCTTDEGPLQEREGTFWQAEEGEGEEGDEDDDNRFFVWEDGHEEGWNLRRVEPSRRFVQLRCGCVPLPTDAAWYAARGVDDVSHSGDQRPGFEKDGITGPGLLRALVAEHRDELLGSQRQLQRLLNPAVQLRPLLTLDDWYHCDSSLYESDQCTPEEAGASSVRFDHQPRYNPTCRAIAQAIVDGSPNCYLDLLHSGRLPRPNTHWRHWVHAGFHK